MLSNKVSTASLPCRSYYMVLLAFVFAMLSFTLFAGQASATLNIDTTGATATVSTVIAGQTATVAVTAKSGTTIASITAVVVNSGQCDGTVTVGGVVDTTAPFSVGLSLPADSAGKHLCVFRKASASGSATVVFDKAIISALPTPFLHGAEAGDVSVHLQWRPLNNSSSATGFQYRQKRGNRSFGNWKDISGSSGSSRAHTVTGLNNGDTYTFKIRAVHTPSGSGITGSVPGPASSAVSATPLAPPAAPSAIVLKSPSTSPGTDITPTFTVTVSETGGKVHLWSTSDCSAGSGLLSFDSQPTVTATTAPFTVDATTKDLDEGAYTVYATYRKASAPTLRVLLLHRIRLLHLRHHCTDRYFNKHQVLLRCRTVNRAHQWLIPQEYGEYIHQGGLF